MCPSVETIQIKNGEILNLPYHNERLNRSNQTLYGTKSTIDLAEHLLCPPEHTDKTLKCRVIYQGTIRRVEMSEYHIKPIRSLRLVTHDTIDYSHKSTDRSELNELYQQRGDAEDILIVKNGLITDTWYANVALLKRGQWYTPASPLLKGTKRAQLIHDGKLVEADITPDKLNDYSQISIINAMIDLGDLVIPISAIQQ